jgi:uncharacterized protein (TIGR02594 family)
MLSIAKAERRAGAREIGGNNQGSFVQKYLRPAGLTPPQPWCAAFVSWCLRAAARSIGVEAPLPYTASARLLWSLGRRRGLLASTPQAGDIVVWSRGKSTGPYGHAGIVSMVTEGGFCAIEGNHSSRVEEFRYSLAASSRLLGFVRLPQKVEPNR